MHTTHAYDALLFLSLHMDTVRVIEIAMEARLMDTRSQLQKLVGNGEASRPRT